VEVEVEYVHLLDLGLRMMAWEVSLPESAVVLVLVATSAKRSFGGGWVRVCNSLAWRSLLGPNTVTLFLRVSWCGGICLTRLDLARFAPFFSSPSCRDDAKEGSNPNSTTYTLVINPVKNSRSNAHLIGIIKPDSSIEFSRGSASRVRRTSSITGSVPLDRSTWMRWWQLAESGIEEWTRMLA
jgi:hypothetical protein